MTHVWIQEKEGTARFVDDIYLPPCNKCGERISKCECKKITKEEANEQV